MHRGPNIIKNRWRNVLSEKADPTLISSIEKKKTTIRVARLVFPKENQNLKIIEKVLESELFSIDEFFDDPDFLFSF
jgi:hypothetical protein